LLLTVARGASDNGPMTVQVPRLPFSLDPLIAEAKRRARNRRVLLVAVFLVLALGSGGTTLAVHPFGWLRTSAPYTGPYEPGGMFSGPGGLPPEVSGPEVQAVSAASSSAAWVLGSAAWRWDGHRWQSFQLPRHNQFYLWSVATVARTKAWAAGWRSRGAGPNHALIEHWNGVRWSSVPLPRLRVSLLYGDRPYPWRTSSMLFGISAAGPRNVWAVGATFRLHARRSIPRATRPLLLHWNGASWREWSLPWSRPKIELDTVVATGPTSVWVVASGLQDDGMLLIEHWNGTRWQAVPPPFGSHDPIMGFGATAWNDAWAVGSYAHGGNRVASYSHGLAAHWNGHSWRLTHVPYPSGNSNSVALTDVAAARPDDAWAIGESQRLNLDGRDGLSETRGPVAYFLHWNGQNWQVARGAAPGIYEGWPAISATSDGSAWAIGDCYGASFIARWTAGYWLAASPPGPLHRNYPSAPARPRRGPTPSCSSPG
jgi:hypothetical protein